MKIKRLIEYLKKNNFIPFRKKDAREKEWLQIESFVAGTIWDRTEELKSHSDINRSP